MMNKLNLLLLAALFGSSLVLVNAAYDTRRLRSELHRAEVESERLEGERKQYEAERQLQATTVRVDRSARERLGMRTVSPAVTMYETAAGALTAPNATTGPNNSPTSGATSSSTSTSAGPKPGANR